MNKILIITLVSFSYFGFSQSLDMKWIKSFTSPGEELWPIYSAPLPNEGLVLSGWQHRPWDSWSCFFVMAVDSSGNELFRDSIEAIGNTEIYLRGVTATPQGEIIVTGFYDGAVRCSGTTLSNSVWGYTTFIARFNNGVLTSFIPIYGANAEQLSSDNQGNLLIALNTNQQVSGLGANWPATNYHDLLVCKISPVNTLVWFKLLSGKVYPTLLVVNPADEAVLFGAFSDSLRVNTVLYSPMHNGPWGGDLFSVYLNSSGNITHSSISHSGILNPTQAIFNNDKIILTSAVCGNHECGAAYQQIDSACTSLWYNGFPKTPLGYGDSYDINHIATIDASGFWAAGVIGKGNPGGAPIVSAPYVFTHFDFNGNVMSSDTFHIPSGSFGSGYGSRLASSSGSSMYVADMFNDSITLYGKKVTGAGNQMFISRLTAKNTPLSINQQVLNELQIYPNPTNGLFIVNVKKSKQKLSVYSSLGALVCTKQLAIGNNEIDLSTQAKGIYCVEVIADGERITKKVVVD